MGSSRDTRRRESTITPTSATISRSLTYYGNAAVSVVILAKMCARRFFPLTYPALYEGFALLPHSFAYSLVAFRFLSFPPVASYRKKFPVAYWSVGKCLT